MNALQSKNLEPRENGFSLDVTDFGSQPTLRFSQRRAWPRQRVKTSAHCSNLRQSLLVQVYDVSEQGIALLSSVCPPLGTYLNLSFKLPGPTVRSMHRCIVIRHFESLSERQQSGEGRGFVVELLDPGRSEERRRLRDFLAHPFALAPAAI